MSEHFITNFIILIIRYFSLCGLSFLIFYILLKKTLNKRKLQYKFPRLTDHFRDISYSTFSSIVFAVVFALTIISFRSYTQIYDTIDEYGPLYFYASFLLMVLVHDTYFYWTHRLIHSKPLFKIIHVVHHKSTNPSPWTVYAFHPLEAFIQALIIPIMAILFPIQESALAIYFLFQFLHNIYGHLGYELLPSFIRNTLVGKLINTSIIHNKHHQDVRGNYGLYFTLWDKLMRTQNLP
jgi:Delta7-sterol 5-desaturase